MRTALRSDGLTQEDIEKLTSLTQAFMIAVNEVHKYSDFKDSPFTDSAKKIAESLHNGNSHYRCSTVQELIDVYYKYRYGVKKTPNYEHVTAVRPLHYLFQLLEEQDQKRKATAEEQAYIKLGLEITGCHLPGG